ncbi:MAG: trypsin-like peptidase domain-containing protein [Planctomycetota bacterium]|nr:trypsin-like peptidase domain-containing protein [Planctomycetota bacterium]
MEFYLEFLKGQNEGEVKHFEKLEVLKVGRNPDSTLVLEDLGVSFDHAELRLRGGAFWLVDRGSTNGSFINGERAYNSKIREGDILKFGKRGPEIRFRNRRPSKKAVPSDRKRIKPSGRGDAPAILATPKKAPAQERSENRSPDNPANDNRAPRRDRRRGTEPHAAVAVANPPVRAEPAKKLSSGQNLQVFAAPVSVTPRPKSKAGKGLTILLSTLLVVSLAIMVFLGLQLVETDNKVAAQKRVLSGYQLEIKTTQSELESKDSDLKRYGTDLSIEKERIQEVQAKLDDLKKSMRRESRNKEQLKKDYEKLLRDKEDKIRSLQESVKIFSRNSSRNNDQSDRVTFQKIQKLYNSSVVLIFTHLKGKDRNGKVVNLSCSGTGFLITRQGHIVTNKHVVQPWKFSKMAQRIANEGIKIDTNSHHIAVWLAGSRYVNLKSRRYNLNTGFSTQKRTLQLKRWAQDEWVTLDNKNSKGPRQIKIHSPRTNADLAVLEILVKKEFKHVIPYGNNDLPIEKLDPVMVLGFPLGTSILESEKAETSPNMGEVRKVEKSIWIAGSMHHGNSGGPVFNRSGRVIGVSTRIVGSENLGACIKIEHALNLLGGSW